MKTLHWQKCEAPICADMQCYTDQPYWKDEVLWYPGEKVCHMTPYTKWQKRQNQINKWFMKGQFKYPNRYFTVNMLLKGKQLYRGRKGGNPDAKEWVKPQKTVQKGRTVKKTLAQHSSLDAISLKIHSYHPTLTNAFITGITNRGGNT